MNLVFFALLGLLLIFFQDVDLLSLAESALSKPSPVLFKIKEEITKNNPETKKADVANSAKGVLNTNNTRWKDPDGTRVEMELHSDGTVTEWRGSRRGTFAIKGATMIVTIPQVNRTSGGQGYKVIYKIISPSLLRCEYQAGVTSDNWNANYDVVPE